MVCLSSLSPGLGRGAPDQTLMQLISKENDLPELVRISIEGRIAHLVFDRPKKLTMGTEWDAIAHTTPSTRVMTDKITELGLKGAISWFNSMENK